MWTVFAQVSGMRLLLAVVLRTVADMLTYVGPIAISGITIYAIDVSTQEVGLMVLEVNGEG